MVHGKPIDAGLVDLVFTYYEEENRSKTAVARRLKKSTHWVSDVLQNYDPKSNERKVKKQRGRPRHTTQEQDEDLLSFVRANRQMSGVKIAAEVGMKHRTLLNRLHESHAQRSKAILNGLKPEHMECRVDWCLLHLEQYVDNPDLYKDVIFTDEVRFDLHGGRLECWYCKGEERTDVDLQIDSSTLTKGGLYVLGCHFSSRSRCACPCTCSEDSEKYTEILLDHLVPYLDQGWAVMERRNVFGPVIRFVSLYNESITKRDEPITGAA